jgi:hypothetical protein
MMKNISVLCMMLLLLTVTAFTQTNKTNRTWTVVITLSQRDNYATNTFGTGIGYTNCFDTSSALPYPEIEIPDPTIPYLVGRFQENFSARTDCLGMGVKTSIHGGSYTEAIIDTFAYQIMTGGVYPWCMTWDTTNLQHKLNSLVMKDAVTDTLLNVNMMTTDSLAFTRKPSSRGFYIYATWKPIDSTFCADCTGPKLALSPSSINFGSSPIGHTIPKTFTIRNNSDLKLTISDITTVPSVFEIRWYVRNVEPRDLATYFVIFTPASKDACSGFAVITSNSISSPDSIRLTGNLTTATLTPTAIPQLFTLHQNYPNPFNPSTLIEYDLPSREYVTLKVFNILGQEVAVLVDEMQEPGYKSVSYETGNLPSGVYIYRLAAGTFVDVKKMLLIR